MRYFLAYYIAALVTIFAFIIGASTFGFGAVPKPDNPATAAIRDSAEAKEINGRSCYEIIRYVDGQAITIIACEEQGE